MTDVPPDWLPMLDNTLWPKEFCSRREDCNTDRCQQRLQVGQCHLMAGHPGMHDPFGLSHPFEEKLNLSHESGTPSPHAQAWAKAAIKNVTPS